MPKCRNSKTDPPGSPVQTHTPAPFFLIVIATFSMFHRLAVEKQSCNCDWPPMLLFPLVRWRSEQHWIGLIFPPRLCIKPKPLELQKAGVLDLQSVYAFRNSATMPARR